MMRKSMFGFKCTKIASPHQGGRNFSLGKKSQKPSDNVDLSIPAKFKTKLYHIV
jgi:hypothetical protein